MIVFLLGVHYLFFLYVVPNKSIFSSKPIYFSLKNAMVIKFVVFLANEYQCRYFHDIRKYC